MPTGSQPEPYSREWHETRMDEHISKLAEAVQGWLDRDREDWRSSNRAAGRLQLVMRAVSAEASDIAAIDSHDRWWGVRAIRD